MKLHTLLQETATKAKKKFTAEDLEVILLKKKFKKIHFNPGMLEWEDITDGANGAISDRQHNVYSKFLSLLDKYYEVRKGNIILDNEETFAVQYPPKTKYKDIILQAAHVSAYFEYDQCFSSISMYLATD